MSGCKICYKKKPDLTDCGVATEVKKPGLTDQGVATGVTKFRMASGGLKIISAMFENHFKNFEKYLGIFQI